MYKWNFVISRYPNFQLLTGLGEKKWFVGGGKKVRLAINAQRVKKASIQYSPNQTES